MATKILITGASGLLGRSIFDAFAADAHWEVLGLAFQRTKGQLKRIDLTNSDEVKEVINSFKPHVVIHSAAQRFIDKVENEPVRSKAINVTATQVICEESKKIGAWVLYISTDYVFDGKNPPYQIDAECKPLNSYGVMKREGELITLQADSSYGILRIPILFNKVENLGESAFTTLFEKVKDTSKPCMMSTHGIRFPIYTKDVAYTIKQMVERQLKLKDMSGSFHWCGGEPVTKYDIAIMMAEVFGISTSHIKADATPPSIPHPFNSQLDCSRLESMNIGMRTPLRVAIKETLEPWLHK